MLNIERIGFYIPNNRLSITDNYTEIGISPLASKVYTKGCGLLYSPRYESDSYSLILKSIEKLLGNYIKIPQIDYIVYVHTGAIGKRDGVSYVNKIKARCKFSHSIIWSISMQDCVSGLQALKIFNSMNLKSKRALIVIGEVPPKAMRIVPGVAVVGDASLAMLISNGRGLEILASYIMIAERYEAGAFMVYKESQTYEANFIKNVAVTINKVMELANKRLTDIKLIIPTNTNVRTWQALAKNINYPFENFFTKNIAKYGHCLGCDAFINLATVYQDKIVSAGDLVLLLFTGIGGQFGSAIVRI